MPAATNVVNLARARRSDEFGEGFHQIEAVNVVAHLFAFVAEDAIRAPGYGADHEIGEKSVQLGAGVCRTGETTAAKRNRRHSKVAFVFLHQDVGGKFGRAKQ